MGTVGTFHGTFESTVTIGHVTAYTVAAQLVDQNGHGAFRSRTHGHSKHINAPSVATGLGLLSLERQERAVNAQPEADAREFLAAELSHQAVVTSTAADTGLRTQPIVHKLEASLGVIVQATHHAGVDHVSHAHVVK